MIHPKKRLVFTLVVLFLTYTVGVKAIQSFASTETTAVPSEYTVNLMWINRSLVKDQK